MRPRIFAAGLLAALMAGIVAAGGVSAHGDGVEDIEPGYGTDTGMMGDYGMGPGMMGGHGMGAGMMWDYGMGPGMMGGHGMGAGMMWDHGMGPGMMGGHGMGAGMMWDYGMGPGMMGSGPMHGLDLSESQQKQMARVGTELRKHIWSLQGEMIDATGELTQLYGEETPDAKKIGAVYGKIFDLRRQMIEAAVDARNRQRAVLTDAQREQLRKGLEQWQREGYDSSRGKMGRQYGHSMMGE